jgi:hypothetical protein
MCWYRPKRLGEVVAVIYFGSGFLTTTYPRVLGTKSILPPVATPWTEFLTQSTINRFTALDISPQLYTVPFSNLLPLIGGGHTLINAELEAHTVLQTEPAAERKGGSCSQRPISMILVMSVTSGSCPGSMMQVAVENMSWRNMGDTKGRRRAASKVLWCIM